MEDIIRIKRGSAKDALALDSDKSINITLNGGGRMVTNSHLSKTIDGYERYLKEKDDCNKYHFIFTINPVCSNVLHNKVTEIVYDEGGDDCAVFGRDGENISSLKGDDLKRVREYLSFKGNSSTSLKREDMLFDTAFSHPNIGKFTYHCGLDIFANHWLRKRDFNVLNRSINESGNTDFNTMADTNRTFEGREVKDFINKLKKSGSKYKNNTYDENGKANIDVTHQYGYIDVMTYPESIKNNLIEEDGWFGFINPSTIEINNVRQSTYDKNGNVNGSVEFSINKCMNNNKPCEMYDLYPDRSLFSVTPKVNKKKNRIEPNWKYCLTYPFANITDQAITTEKVNGVTINGIEAFPISDAQDVFAKDGSAYSLVTSSVITFMTNIKHNLSVGDYVEVTAISAFSNSKKAVTPSAFIRVVSVGFNGNYGNHVFSISAVDLFDELDISNEGTSNVWFAKSNGREETLEANKLYFTFKLRVRKVVDSIPCKYYIRELRKIPNFKFADINLDGDIKSSDIAKYAKNDNGDAFVSSLNNLAFAKNIYGDSIGQIVYNEEVDLSKLKDNLGRQVSEVFLTVIKANDGYKEWYGVENTTKNVKSDKITESHCFGKITQGFDLPYFVKEDNVHKMHNINMNFVSNTKDWVLPSAFFDSPSPSFMSGKTEFKEITASNDVFIGDIVEFSVSRIEETVLEDIQYRFNTVQREYTATGDFRDIFYEEITTDDFDVADVTDNEETKYEVKKMRYNEFPNKDSYGTFKGKGYYANLDPEGYYYKPHYGIRLFDFDNEVKQGQHTRVVLSANPEHLNGFTMSEEGFIFQNYFKIKTSVNFQLYKGIKILIFNKRTNSFLNCDSMIVQNGEKFMDDIILGVESGITSLSREDYIIFRYNYLKPSVAFELNDGTGRYVWRDKKKEIKYSVNDPLYDRFFTNGRFYFHKGINLYLKRQDPLGDYGLNLSYNENVPSSVNLLSVGGDSVDTSHYENKDTELNAKICGIDVGGVFDKAENLGKNFVSNSVNQIYNGRVFKIINATAGSATDLFNSVKGLL